jgi:hypothetical protein
VFLFVKTCEYPKLRRKIIRSMKKKLYKIFGVGLALTLLASLTLMSAPVGALGSASVSLDSDEISDTGVTYTFQFTVASLITIDDDETTATYEFTIEFGDGTDLSSVAAGDVTIGCNSGIGTAAFSDVQAATVVDTGEVLQIEIDDDDGDLNPAKAIGPGATVQVVVANVTNSDDIGEYTCWVETSAETTAVETNSYELGPPTVPALPGIVEVYNPNDILISSYTGSNAIITAIGDATAADWTIVIGPGTYGAADTFNTAVAGVTFVGEGDLGTIIWQGAVTIDVADTVITGITFENGTTTVTGADCSIDGCQFQDGGVIVSSGAGCEITDCTFAVDDGDTGVTLNDDADVTDCDFTVEDGGTAISIADAADGTDVDGCTFTGASGDGIILVGDTDVTDCTFDGLDWALAINGGTQVISGNAVTACDEAAISVGGAGAVVDARIVDNTFTGNDEAAIITISDASNAADEVYMLFNTITGNAGDDDGLLVDNNDGADFLCPNNWWGDRLGPGSDAFEGNVVATPYLPGPLAAGSVMGVGTGTLNGRTAVGAYVETDAGTMDLVAAGVYEANPGTTVSGTVEDYWDVCVVGTTGVNEITIRLYGDVLEGTEAYVWGESFGEWIECTNYTVNLFSGFVGIVIDDDSTPTIDDLEGLPFVVVTPPAAPPTVVLTSMVPAQGADDVSVDPNFSWGAVAGATYNFALAEENPLASDPFDIPDYSASTDINAHPCQQTLKYSTTYYWRVRATVGDETGPWTTALFTTEAEPEETVVDVPDITVEPAEITVQPADVDITVEPAQPVIPDYLLWVIIGVGAVLVIALIVLIVRTRRTA